MIAIVMMVHGALTLTVKSLIMIMDPVVQELTLLKKKFLKYGNLKKQMLLQIMKQERLVTSHTVQIKVEMIVVVLDQM